MSETLGDAIPTSSEASTDLLLERFLAYVAKQGLSLYPAQEEAILALLEGHHVILATPTGSGKSLVALAMHFISLARGERSYYTAPIKALVSEKFFALSAELGAERVGLMTGDASVNRDASVIACTAEILAKVTLREGRAAQVGSAVMDEFHFYGDRERGVSWQLPLLGLPSTQFLLMSATLGDTRSIEEDLQTRTGRPVTVIRTMERPVPLEREYRESPIHETLRELIDAQRAPVYVVHFTQRGAAEHAQELLSTEVVSKEQKQRIKERLQGFRFDTPFGKDLGRFVRHGVAVHHAGLLPKYRRLVEKLAQEGLLAVICGTDTLGVGVNVPIRTVLFTQLCKYDGTKTAVLTVRDFQQIAGRAGRRGFDTRGWVVAEAPEHMIENRTLRMKAEGDPKKMKKLVLKKPPEKGYAHWDASTFERLSTGTPETLEPRFTVTQGMVLEVVSGAWDRREDGLRELLRLIRTSHVGRKQRFALARLAISIVRALLARGVLVVATEAHEGKERRVLAPSADLQQKFALNQGLSLFAVDVIDDLDTESETYALDVLSVIEATLEDPEAVLVKQLDERKKEKLDALKAEGVPFEERMAELEKIDVDRPLAPLLYEALDVFVEQNPWVAKEELRPKSIARDAFQRGAGFADYVRDLSLARSEGLLLRYLSDAYKGLVSNVPEGRKTEALLDLEGWLGTVVRGVDSSLLDEWQRLATGPVAPVIERAPEQEQAPDVTRDVRGFAVMVRNASYRLLVALARRRFEDASTMVVAPEGKPEWVPRRLDEAMQAFFEAHAEVVLDATARAPASCILERNEREIRVTQVMRDPEDDHDFRIALRVDLAASREAGAPVLELQGIGT